MRNSLAQPDTTLCGGGSGLLPRETRSGSPLTSRLVQRLDSPAQSNSQTLPDTDTDHECEVCLSSTDTTECRFFATFWTSWPWSNLTVTLTLIINTASTQVCKRAYDLSIIDHYNIKINQSFLLFKSCTHILPQHPPPHKCFKPYI